jgi:predicted flavoprotein YhiN
VNDSLESKKEKGLYFTGELLDIDGMCGGYNLMFAFASAEKVKKALGE